MEKNMALLNADLLESLKDIDPIEKKIRKLIRKVRKLAAGNGYSKKAKMKAREL